MGLGGQTIAPQPLFQTQLYENTKAHFFAMQNGVTGFELSQSVVDGMGSHGSATRSPQSADHSRRESAGLHHALPGFAAGVRHGIETVEQ